MVRAEGKRIAFAEIILGRNQNLETASERLKKVLEANGYTVGDMEYPTIKASGLPPWDPR
jgi:hypothetical protein